MLRPTARSGDIAPNVREVDAWQRQHVDVNDCDGRDAGPGGEEGEVEQRASVEGTGAQLLGDDDHMRDACRRRRLTWAHDCGDKGAAAAATFHASSLAANSAARGERGCALTLCGEVLPHVWHEDRELLRPVAVGHQHCQRRSPGLLSAGPRPIPAHHTGIVLSSNPALRRSAGRGMTRILRARSEPVMAL